MSIPSFSVRNPVLVNMFMWVILIGGALFSLTLVREMFPESRPNKILISSIYPGVQPEEIEKAVTIKIEEAVNDVQGIEKVDSTISEGMSTTVVTLLQSVDDVDVIVQEIKAEVDAVQDLPDGVEKTVVRKFEPDLPVIAIAIYGDGEEQSLKKAARDLRDEMLSLPGVSRVEINGTRGDEISVEIQPERLLEYDITFEQVAAAIRQSNIDISGGQLKGTRSSVAVRTIGEETRGVDLEDIVIRSDNDGQKILLSDVATIVDDFVETDLESRFDGKPAVSCTVYKTKGEDAVQISAVIKSYVAGKRGEDFVDPNAGLFAPIVRLFHPDYRGVYDSSVNRPFDHDFEIKLHTDIARFVEGRLDLLTRNGQAGLILVLISLNLFLNWRVALWAAIGLVVSFLGTFIVMWLLGASVNLLSMFGLIIVLGIIVDDAIVIGENIYRHREEGMPPMQAAIKGTEEVMWPVIVAVMTTIGAFAPLFFITGTIGTFMGQLPIVVIAALSISLIEALIILPAHLSHLPEKKKKEQKHNGVGARLSALQDTVLQKFLMRPYERLLRTALTHRYITVSTAAALVILSVGLVVAGIVESTFIQKMDSETLICNLDMPVGTTADKLREQMEQLDEFIVNPKNFPEVSNVQSFVARQVDVAGEGAVGSSDQSHLGQLIIELVPADKRDKSSMQLLSEFRAFCMTELRGLNSVKWQEMNGGPGGNDLEIRVTGKNFDDLALATKEVKETLVKYAGVFDLDDNRDLGKREVQLRLRAAAEPTGISVTGLGMHVRGALYGQEARRLTRNREDVKIMVRYPESFREDVYNVEDMWVPAMSPVAGSGIKWVPLREVAELTEGDAYTSINRSRQQRSLTVFGSVDRAESEPANVLRQFRVGPQLPTQLAIGLGLAGIEYKPKSDAQRIMDKYPGVTIEYLGQAEEIRKSFSSLGIAFPVAMLLIYTMLAGLFKSYTQPLVVMSAIPFGLLGAVIGHWITGEPMTILSWIGMVALTGILVNDSLVLVDFINKRIEGGMAVFEASVQGAKLRLRAILLTTLTTAAGLTPLMFETSFQAKFLIPMAVTLTFGLIFATALTLVIVPTLNLIVYDIKGFRSEIWQFMRHGKPPNNAA